MSNKPLRKKTNDIKGIILAGGSGNRLWPLSRDLYPKQLLKIDGKLSLLQNTYKTLSSIVNHEDIITITNVKNLNDVKLQLKKISNDVQILAEPMSKNTAPAILASLQKFKNKEDIVIIVPSDQNINDIEKFKESIKTAKNIAKNGYIVTFGIKPTYPATGYGYIKINNKISKQQFNVEKFIEKPPIQKAEEYIKSQDYFWNSGIYAAKISVLIKYYKSFLPEMSAILSDDIFDKYNKIKYSAYENVPNISIDYSIIEKADKLAMIPISYKIEDFGSWKALYDFKRKDKDKNIISGNVITKNVTNSLIYSSKSCVAVSGLKNIIVIDTDDAVLVCNKDSAEKVKDLHTILQKNSELSTIMHKTIFRPWGYYTCLNEGEGYLTKIISVQPEQKLSLQSHEHRSEHWVVLKGTATVILNDNEITLKEGETINIPINSKHSLQNLTEDELKILEVQKGDYISEDDIIRYNDIYGRTN